MTIKPKCLDVETSRGVPVTVTGVAQVKQKSFLVYKQFTSKIPLISYCLLRSMHAKNSAA